MPIAREVPETHLFRKESPRKKEKGERGQRETLKALSGTVAQNARCPRLALPEEKESIFSVD